LLSRADLFGDPIRQGALLSARGDQVAFLAPRDGITNLWVLSVDAGGEARPVTDDRTLGVARFWWAADSATLIFAADADPHAQRLFAVSAGGGEPIALSPLGANAELVSISAADPGAALIAVNAPGAPADVYRVDLVSGARALVFSNPTARPFARFYADAANNVRLGQRRDPTGGQELVLLGDNAPSAPLVTIPIEDLRATAPITFASDGLSFLMYDSMSRDHTALVRVDIATGAKTVLGEAARADVVDVWLDPATNAPEAFATEYLRREWRALNTETQADLDFLDAQLAGDFSVVSRSADDGRWIVVEEGPTRPARSYLYDRSDRNARRLTLLFRHRPGLEQAPLQPMTPVEIAARDGLTIVSYITLPPGADTNGDARPETAAPLVLAVHDGPWARDFYGFSAMHQWLANRGYAVMSVNFRGSTGFGKAFLSAGDGEWGGRMQEDLLDALHWAIANGVAEPDRVAIVGVGFGGYAALSGLAGAPDQFRCGASFGAPVSLPALVDGVPVQQRDEWYRRVGDPRTPEGRDRLRSRSPQPRAIRDPLLLSSGGRDRGAPMALTDQFAAIARVRGALTYLVFPNEAHDLRQPRNRLSYLAVLEHFLGDCLGGRVEPVGASFEGAEMIVYDGAINVPGLSAFARRPPAPPPAPPPEVPEEDARHEEITLPTGLHDATP
jgi:dipeptidyl aminopeptidase/acylaminoacyl peptidase